MPVTAVPPTAVPPTAVPPTAVPPTAVPQRPPVLDQAPTIDRSGPSTVIALHGELDAARLNELKYAVAKAIQYDDRDVLIDLSDIGFICAGTIGTLVSSRAVLESLSRTLTIEHASSHTSKILAICGVA